MEDCIPSPGSCPDYVPGGRRTLTSLRNDGNGSHILSTYHIPDTVLIINMLQCTCII